MSSSVEARSLRIPLLWALLLHCGCLCTSSLQDNCIWKGSGSPGQGRPSVTRAETTCNLGELHWTKPYGGLRITFHPRDVHTGFKLCFTCQYPGISIYREGLKNLTLLRDPTENDVSQTMCITTTGEHAVLYLETNRPNHTMLKLSYSVLLHGRKKPRNRRPKECRPCRYLKLLESFCTSDFVVRGYINSTFPLGSGQIAQADVIATDVIRQRNSIFVKRRADEEEYFTSIKVPNGCHWKQSRKQLFLLTGNVQSGKGPVLGCHIKEEIWVKLQKDMILHLCQVLYR